MDNWISVDDALPDEGVDVLTYREDGQMYVESLQSVGSVCGVDWAGDEMLMSEDCYYDAGVVLYWQPLPDAPKGVSDD